ncbi:DUF2288 domain-containing protein [Verrucomicrobiaceae bacterium R5-34]|uniref:DUF2288 domain-containing protein n=1 Tax=Oceaniferula flava TaxID=2800421 RepID=A0AAE2S914_9BACT|nr:DUF2288 domain-containing protein [Oceaniferula flavus]MBK1829134.1 DUF2288 domain-containing protein [Verrucomicrobiaceae bacterium R5-34]MBK1853370.1 DUF2288 domain-containing protein [Oceaniferula flavus]MBM1134675.1 DUF2288 domain-containing protein [Oceaniferula flavus]
MNTPDQSPEPMKYGILGEDTQNTEEKLKKYTGVVDWPYLEPHYESGALLYVDPSLSITEVGMALTEDDKPKIEGWLKSGDLVKPSAPHKDWWEKNPQSFTALVVSPFVLMQPAP